MTGLSRDAAHANQTLSPIFDKEKEQNRLATAQKIGEIGRQVSDVLVTQGKLNAQAAQSDPAARAAARAKLVAGGNGSPSEEQISAQVSRTATADYDTGGKYQKAAQAVTAAMQGLAGGNLAQAASGAVSPYVAEIIHSQTTDSATGKVNVEANAMAHAVWGAIAAASGNNSALAGAAGAVSGELLGRWIAAEYYPDVKTEELSDEQKSTISALSTLAAGLMGGLSGGSSADAVAGAQAGKNAVENNLMGGNEWSQGEKAREHGADVLSCADNPSGEACQRGIAENKAYAGALASAGLIYLPGGMQITGAIGGTANAGIQYLINGEVNPTDVLIATYVGAFTANTGAWGTVGWNAAGGATSSYLNGDDPFKGGVISGAASGIGYGIGKVAKISLDKWVNPAWKNYEWVNLEMGISKPLPLSPIPGISGNAISSIITEATGQGGSKTTNNLWKRTENEK